MDIQNFSYQLPDGRQLFDQLSVTFLPGHLNLLLGVNGVGKTTLLDFISGVTERKDLPFHGFPPMTRVAYQMQGVPFTGSATVLDTLQMMLTLDQPKATLTAAQLPASLQAISQTHFRDLSGGQRRLVILMGICQLQRDLYLFDEPESGLDVKVATDVLDRINQLATRGKTVIMTTHQFRHLPTNNVHILVLTSQGITFTGTPAELMATTQTTNLEDAYLATDA